MKRRSRVGWRAATSATVLGAGDQTDPGYYARWIKRVNNWRRRVRFYLPENEHGQILYDGVTNIEAQQTLQPLEEQDITKDDGVDLIVAALADDFSEDIILRKTAYLTAWERFERREGES